MNEKVKQTILDSLYERLATMENKRHVANLMLDSRINLANRGHTQHIRTRAQNEIESWEALVRRCQIDVDDTKEAISAVESIVCK